MLPQNTNNDKNRIQTANTKNQSPNLRIIGAVFVYPKAYLQTSTCDRLIELCSHPKIGKHIYAETNTSFYKCRYTVIKKKSLYTNYCRPMVFQRLKL